MSNTTTLLGTLRTEQVTHIEVEQTEAGPRSITLLRPAGTGVRNDGYRGYWMASGWTYELHHDGTGWRVERQNWVEDHILRLVDAEDGIRWVSELPVDGGTVVLEVGQRYELRAQAGVWEIHQV